MESRRSNPFLLFLIAMTGLLVLYQMFTRDLIDSEAIASSNLWYAQNIHRATDPVLVTFGADWCGNCRCFDGKLHALEPMLRGRMKMLRVDVEEEPELAQAFGVWRIPHSVIIYHGKIVSSQRGGMAQGVLENRGGTRFKAGLSIVT